MENREYINKLLHRFKELTELGYNHQFTLDILEIEYDFDYCNDPEESEAWSIENMLYDIEKEVEIIEDLNYDQKQQVNIVINDLLREFYQ
jgi:hypothetical protein